MLKNILYRVLSKDHFKQEKNAIRDDSLKVMIYFKELQIHSNVIHPDYQDKIDYVNSILEKTISQIKEHTGFFNEFKETHHSEQHLDELGRISVYRLDIHKAHAFIKNACIEDMQSNTIVARPFSRFLFASNLPFDDIIVRILKIIEPVFKQQHEYITQVIASSKVYTTIYKELKLLTNSKNYYFLYGKLQNSLEDTVEFNAKILACISILFYLFDESDLFQKALEKINKTFDLGDKPVQISYSTIDR